jgi:hypothetical protein
MGRPVIVAAVTIPHPSAPIALSNDAKTVLFTGLIHVEMIREYLKLALEIKFVKITVVSTKISVATITPSVVWATRYIGLTLVEPSKT